MRTLYRVLRVHTFTYPATGEWILVDDRHVQRVGTGDPPEADRVVDLPGTTALPGFVDAHVHLTGTGMQLQAPEIADARSSADLLRIARTAVERRAGPTLLYGFDESPWADRSLPTIAELDAASPQALAIVRVDGHVTIANARAIDASGALHHEGVERDPEGHPTGRVTRKANDTLNRWFATNLAERDVEEFQLEAAGLAVSHGVTTIHEMSMPQEHGIRDLEVLLRHRARLPLDVVPYVATTDISQAMDLGLPCVGGDLPVDGSIGARTAWVSSPYEDSDREPAGYFHDDVLAGFFHEGHLAGLQVGVHAIGDAAIEQVVRTWERVYQSLDSRQRRHFRARRHRIEHFEMPGGTVLERTAMLGLGVCVQPSFDATWGFPGGLYEQGLGPERAAAMNPFRDMLERGMEVGAGSDSPITSIDPLAGIGAFENHHDAGQRLSRAEALRIATMGSARLAHQEDKKGSLEPGKHADFAVYDTDPLETDAVEGLRPILTVSLGRDVFAR
jgi:predicted amidohydrolase YtcJ